MHVQKAANCSGKAEVGTGAGNQGGFAEGQNKGAITGSGADAQEKGVGLLPGG